MSCQEFEPILIECARERLLDAVARQRALTHVECCSACAALLADERALSTGLREFGAAVAAETAPPQLESVLLAAFRQQAAAPVRTLAPASSPVRRSWWLAVAALLLLTFGLAFARWQSRPGAPERIVAEAPPPLVTPSANLQSMILKTPVQVEAPPEKPVGQRGSPVFNNPKRANRAARAPRRLVEEPALLAAEYVTEFYPLMRGGELIPLEGGQIVRVQLPRSNLIPLGLPVNQERAAETVKADVLVSHDGLARAIRLVY
jgi:hypothetical protein